MFEGFGGIDMSENKHLTLDERNFIEQELAKNTTFREIAMYLSKDPTTISKEVKKHRIRKEHLFLMITEAKSRNTSVSKTLVCLSC